MKEERKTKLQLLSELQALRQSEKNLRNSEQKIQSMLDSIGEGVSVTDLDLNLIDMNKAMLHLYGYDHKDEVIGQNAFSFIAPKDHPKVRANMKKTIRDGHSGEVEITLLTRDGKTYDAEISAALLRDKPGNATGFISTTKDITERKRAAEEILQRNRELAALNAIAQTVSQTLDLDEVLNNALDKTLEILNIKHGTIAFLDREAERLTLRTVRGISEADIKAISPIQMGEDIIGLVAESGDPLFVESLIDSSELMRNYTLEVVVEQQLKSVMYVPLKAKGNTLGVMCTFTQGDRIFTPEEHKLLTTIGHEISAAIENALLYQGLQQKEEIRGQGLRQSILAQEEERRRIARELHDQTSQVLTGASAKIEASVAALPDGTDEVKTVLKETRVALTDMMDDIRRIIYELRPSTLDDLGLVAAVRWHAKEYLERAGVKPHFEIVGRRKKLSPQIETALFRIIQEAMTNVVKHAQAKNVSVKIGYRKGSVSASVMDDGKGFNLVKVTSPKRRQRRLGLVSMKERADILNGSFAVNSRPGFGTQVTVDIPI